MTITWSPCFSVSRVIPVRRPAAAHSSALEVIKGPLAAGPMRQLGTVVGGSLSHGLEVRLDGEVDVEEMAVGTYATNVMGTVHFLEALRSAPL